MSGTRKLAAILAADAVGYSRLGRAPSSSLAGLSLAPNFTVRRFLAAGQSDNATYLAQRARIIDGMRKAGVPEGWAA